MSDPKPYEYLSPERKLAALQAMAKRMQGDDRPPPRVVRNHDVLGAGSPRTCGFCGDRDPRWHGHDSQGWTCHLGLDRCPSCTFADPPPLERERETR